MIKVSEIKKWVLTNRKKLLISCLSLLLMVIAFFCLLNKWETDHKENGDNYDAVIWQGEESNVVKTNEQQECLVIGTIDMINSSQTYLNDDQASNITNALVYESLIHINQDQTLEMILADEITFSEDGLRAEVTLKDSMFSDGSILTANNVKEAYLNILKNSNTEVYLERCCNIEGIMDYIGGKSSDIKGITVETENKLSVQFNQVAAWNMQAFVLPIFKAADQEGEKALGTGPYKMETYQHNESIQLIRNEMNKSSDLGFENIIVKRFSTLSLSENVKNFEIDVFALPYWNDLEEIKEAGYHSIYHILDEKNTSYFRFNLDDEAGGKNDLRNAVTKAIDREEVSKGLYAEEVLNYSYLSAAADNTEHLSRNVDQAEKLLKSIEEPKVKYYGAIDTAAKLRFDGIKDSLEDADIIVERGSEGEHTLSFVQTGNEIILKDQEEYILSTEKKEEYCKKIRAIYQENSEEWMEKVEEYYEDECFLIPYSANSYYLVISSDVDSAAIRELIVNHD